MRVIIDYQGFFQEIGGVSRCFYELTRKLPLYIDVELLVKYSDNIYLKEMDGGSKVLPVKMTLQNFLPALKFRGKHRLFTWIEKHFESFPTFSNSNRKYAKKVLKDLNFDVYHCSFYDDFFTPHINKRPFVVTVHDMIWELYPSSYFQKHSERKRRICEEATHIIAVSECTKKDLIKLWGIDEKKITVVYHGSPEGNSEYGHPIINKRYFLYVGARDGYKNFIQTISDFAEFHKKHPDVQLVCTGVPFNKFEQNKIHNHGLDESVTQLFVKDNELANLYHYAIAFIYPSVYEGFGIPILEAFTHQCIVMLNNKSCFPEIGGDAAIYFNSEINGPSDLPKAMEQVYALTAQQKQQIIESGQQRAQKFSWKESARKLAEVYKSLV